MGADCLGGQYAGGTPQQAKSTGALPINKKFEGPSANSTKYGDKSPAQPEDSPTKTGW